MITPVSVNIWHLVSIQEILKHTLDQMVPNTSPCTSEGGGNFHQLCSNCSPTSPTLSRETLTAVNRRPFTVCRIQTIRSITSNTIQRIPSQGRKKLKHLISVLPPAQLFSQVWEKNGAQGSVPSSQHPLHCSFPL